MLHCASHRRVGARLRRFALLSSVALSLGPASSASAVSVGVELLVAIDGQPCPQPSCTAFGGADAATNVPLDLAVSGGEQIDVYVLIDLGLPIRQYQTAVTLNEADLAFQGATDVSTLGFSLLADPNDTLTDGTPGSGDADSNLCDIVTCTAPSTNTLYVLSFVVGESFAPDALRDLTVSVEAITFDRDEDELDAARDTASLRLVLVPEPGTALLVAAGLVALGGRRRGGSR